MSRATFALLALGASVLAGLASPLGAHAQPLIVLDAGHGGTDPGAVGCSLQEADVVLDVALRLRTILETAGLRVALTRDVDEFVGLSARASFANAMAADGFVSVHSNANGGTPASGTETWIANAAGARSLALAEALQAEMVAAWGLPDRGVKRADFVVVRDTTMPAALTELAFTNRCMPDAALLGSPAERQSMAEAQARAILDWLGVAPGVNGTLRGVVFEDQGVGTMDLSVRLPGATVRIAETGATATADATEAAWLFGLPAGSYTVEVSAAGHVMGSRRCDVMSGATTWCSVGLFPTAAPVDAGPVASPDASVAPDDASAPPPDAASSAAPDASGVARPNAGGCGCSVAVPHAPRALGWLVTLSLLGLALRRRRRAARAGVALLAALTIGGCDPALDASTEPLSSLAPEAPGPARALVVRAEVGEPVRVLEETEALLRAPDRGETELLTAPVLSPDGTMALLATPDFGALYLWRASAAGAPTSICATRGCGYEPRWIDATHVATRTPEQDGSAIPGDAFDLAGAPSAERLGARGALAWVEAEDRVLVRLDGEARVLRAHDDRFVRAELSPDRRHVVVWGLTTGLSLHRLSDGARFDLGAGGSPRFDPEGAALVFDRTDDEGHVLTAGDVFLATLGDEVTVRAVAVGERVEHLPSISRIDPDGRATLAFMRDGALVLAQVALR